MNKIGIFGDSFGEHCSGVNDVNIRYDNQVSWITNIGTHSHARGGTDIQYSFRQFEKHHSKYDQIIFILTHPMRMTLFDENDNIIRYVGPGPYVYAQSKIANKRNLFELRDMWKALSGIDIVYSNESYRNRCILNYNLVVQGITQIRPDVKFLAAFDYLGNPEIPNITSSLSDIVLLEENMMQWHTYRDGDDLRIAHLTEESHIILTKLIKEWLKTDEMFFDFDMKEFDNINPDRNKYDASR
mgnify:CR=1 FL=1|jgi:hypothetical protein